MKWVVRSCICCIAYYALGCAFIRGGITRLSSAQARDENLFNASATDTQVQLSWPSAQPGAVIAYQAGSSIPSCSSGTLINSSSISGTTYTVSGLTPKTQYAFRLCFVSSSGTTTGTMITATTAATPTISISYSPDFYCKGQVMTALSPTVTGTVDSYTISPALPVGMTLNTSSGVISGTPTVATANTTYTVTATRWDVTATATVSFPVGQNFTVNTTTDTNDANAGDGICDDSLGKCSLRAAIQESSADAVAACISIPAGTYTLTTGATLSATQSIALLGANQTTTIIDGTGTTSGIIGFSGNGNTLKVDKLTFQNGNDSSTNGAGALYVSLGTALIENCSFSNNKIGSGTEGGGAIGIYSSPNIIIDSSTFSNNSASDVNSAGGIADNGISGTNSLNVTDSVFNNNSNSWFYASGIFVEAISQLNIAGSTFKNGVTAPALYIEYMYGAANTISISTSTFENNPGGIYLYAVHEPMEMVNSTISNSTNVGVDVQDGGNLNAVALLNDTIADNGDNLSTTFTNSGSQINFINTIVSSESAGANCSSALPAGQSTVSYSLFTDSTCGVTGTGVITGDPLLGALTNNGGTTDTRLPATGSPVIDAGTNTGCPLTDQRGDPRPVDKLGGGAICDIGAVEIQ